MILFQVMSTSCLILGAYILGILLLGPSQSPIQTNQFHVGCYLLQQNLSHSWMISSSLLKIKSHIESPRLSLPNVVSFDYFDSKALNIATTFESYLKEQREQKQNMSNYFQLFRATKEAQDQYLNCSRLILHNPFSPEQCFSDWSKLGNCSVTLNTLRDQVRALLGEKDQIESRMNGELFRAKSAQGSRKGHSSQHKRVHKEKDRELEIEERNLEMSSKVTYEKLVNTRYNLGVSENQTLNSKHLYRECTEHRYEFQLCQQMSQEIRGLGHGSFENLSEKMEKKRGYIIRIQGMLADNSKIEREELFSLHNRSLNEYRKLHKIFAEIKAKIDKNCGCSEGEEQKLYQVLQMHMREQKQLRSQLLSLENTHSKISKQLNMLKERRRLLYSELEKQENQSKQTAEQTNSFEILRNLAQQQAQIKAMIINYESKFQQLAMDYEGGKRSMQKMMSQVQAISSCQGKKDYYMNMKASLTKYRQKLSVSTVSRQRLAQLVRQFNL